MTQSKRILVTGGAGFIGSALIRHVITETDHQILNVDKLTYAGDLRSLESVSRDPRYRFLQADVSRPESICKAIWEFQPDIITHLAAEIHVDRSISGSGFSSSNIVEPSYVLSKPRAPTGPSSRATPSGNSASTTSQPMRFMDRWVQSGLFHEGTPYDPRSPYSAPKPRAIIWSTLGTTPTDCRWSSPIARTTMGPSISRKSSSRLSPSTRSKASRCRFTATGSTSAIGSMSRIMSALLH